MKRKFKSFSVIIGLLVTIVLLITSCTGTDTETTTGTAAPGTTTTTTRTATTTATTTATATGTATTTATTITTTTATTTTATTTTTTASPTTTTTTTTSPSPTTTTTTTASPTTTTTTTTTTGTATATATATATGTATATTTAAVGGTVEVLGIWGSTELDSFNAMVAPWLQKTGARINFTGTRDLTAVLTTRIQAGNPPDIAILPNPGLMKQYANAGNLKALDAMLDMDTIEDQYPESWIDLGTVDDSLYALFIKAANKSMVWYNPSVFSDNDWEVPGTWDELITLSDDIVSAGGTPPAPWAMGVESQASSGWPGTDWIAQIFLAQNGGDVYDQWVAHQIPWTDSRIKEAWEMWGKIVTTQGYVPGGPQTVLATNFQDASYWPFQDPPQAAMYYEGDFVQGFITSQFPDLEAGTDFDYFPFPTVNDEFENAVTGGADLIVAFKDTPTVRSFISYMASPEAQTIWVKRGGFVSVNTEVNVDDYPDDIVQKSVQQLLDAETFRFGAGDSMPGAMQTAWWAGILQYLQNPSQLDSILQNLENTAKTAYSATAAPSASASGTPSPGATTTKTTTTTTQ